MRLPMLHSWEMQVQDELQISPPAEVYGQVFRALKPRTPLPEVSVEFCKFANANSFIKMSSGKLEVRVTDMLEGAPLPIVEALAYILLSKLFRQPVPRLYSSRYRSYFNRSEMRRTMHLVRQQRGRKHVSGPEGKHHDLTELFESINARFFNGLMARPNLGWTPRISRTVLGHFDPSHNAIIISRIFDRPEVPRLALEYVMYHEMLHLRFPVENRGSRRCIHTPEFKTAEKTFPELKHAKELLKKL